MTIKTGEDFNKWREKETIRKQAWRRKKGRAYADERNKHTLAYQKTFVGIMSLRTGATNSGVKLRGVTGRITSGDLIDIWKGQNDLIDHSCLCAKCKTRVIDWVIDHIIPLKDGGTHSKNNIQLLCEGCHTEKTRIDRDVYKEDI